MGRGWPVYFTPLLEPFHCLQQARLLVPCMTELREPNVSSN